MTHESGKPYSFIRKIAQDVFWPRVEQEYRDEIQGIADGLQARNVKLDLWDVVAMNAAMEIAGYYLPSLDPNKGRGTQPVPTPRMDVPSSPTTTGVATSTAASGTLSST